MRKLLPLLLAAIAAMAAPRPAHATISVVQHVKNDSCPTNSSSCTITVASTGSGHAGVLVATTGGTNDVLIYFATDADETWIGNLPSAELGYGRASAAYTLALGSGLTSIIVWWWQTYPGESSTPAGPTRLDFYEIAYTGAGVGFDIFNTNLDSSCETCAIPPASLSGGNDIVIAAGYFTAARSGCSSPYVAPSAAFDSIGATCYALNQSGTVTGNWTASSYGTGVGVIIAIAEISHPSSGGMPAIY